MEKRNNPAPLILLAEGGSPLSISRCRQLESNPLWCQELWEKVFDIDHIKPNRRRYGQDYQNPFAHNALSFKHTATTDGCMVHVQFEKFIGNSPELFPSTHDEIRRLPEGQDLTYWSHGVYRLELNPDGLTQQRAEESRIVGVDPGVSSMITGVSTAEEPVHNPIEVTTRKYHAETGVFWEYKLENKNRQKAEIQEDYDSIAENSPYVSRSEDFLFYIANLNRIRLRMRRFSSGFKQLCRAKALYCFQGMHHQKNTSKQRNQELVILKPAEKTRSCQR
ncbi:hypothetical protein BDB00DRAFT_521048 [Zychaea mexicana]|uniref:uncharacterized protein n=1 Tax=Zychaea mexicana TaxID=64656 RepID=UPI0022FF2735|nr:uncharacterized protein BDB00DRAFT_521048 [Zychaea mexicana]KAI9490946.1 hypothetical protein BDB00DRAFT_521048 [Zychaea mexicana]